MSLDARTRYTKMVITESFIKLLKTKPFCQIKLREVCELAEIHRSTFYKYYRDIYDWREQMEDICLQSARDIINQCNCTDIKIILKKLLESMRKNIDFISVLFSVNWGNSLIERLAYIIYEKVEPVSKIDDLSENRKWNYCFIVCGCIGIIQCWINDDMKQSIDEIIGYITENIERLSV